VRFPPDEAGHLYECARRERKTYSEIVRAAIHALTPEGIMEELAARHSADDGITIADIGTIVRLCYERRWDVVHAGESISLEQSVLSGRARRVITLTLESIDYQIVADAVE
jgi:hypothetical protein